MSNIEKYIDLKAKEKEVKEALKELEPYVLEDLEDTEEHKWYKITKSLRMNLKLKEWVDDAEIFEEYPEATQIKLDMKALSETDWAKKYIDIQEKEYLIVRKSK